MPRLCEVVSFTFSRAPSRYSNWTLRLWVTVDQASSAPACCASSTACAARALRSTDIFASYRHVRDQHGRDTLRYGHALAVLAAGPAARVEPRVVRNHRDALQRLRPVADDVDVLDRRRDLAV